MKIIASFLIALAVASSATAEQVKSREQAQALLSSLKFRTGQISLHDGLATLTVPQGFKFLDGPDANKIIVDLWGNPPSEPPLGLLMPDAKGALSRDSWAVIINYEGSGYVKDKDAEKINYNDLLERMKKDVHGANPERKRLGYPEMELVGWAAPPRYDEGTHKLYWAKELKFGETTEDTLNYNIRILGRHGVLILNAVASVSQLPEITQATPAILSAVDYTPGNRYADFNPASGDKVATYGIAALVAGGVAAKAGLFKVLWVGILAAKKFIIIGVAAIATWFRKLLGKKKVSNSASASDTLSGPAA